jgi:hypothetical protein
VNALSFAAENWDALLLIGGTVAGWLGFKRHQTKEDDRWELMLSLGRQALSKLLTDSRLYDDAYVRQQIATAIWAGLARLGLKKTKASEKLVAEVVEILHGELAERMWEHHFGKLASKLEETSDTLKKL